MNYAVVLPQGNKLYYNSTNKKDIIAPLLIKKDMKVRRKGIINT